MSDALVSPDDHLALDGFEAALLASSAPLVDLPVKHRFTPGLYTREIFMPAGTLLTSRIHKTEHPYVITKGRVSVFIPGGEVQHLEAGHVGITKPGTRRILYVHEDCTWLTFHPTQSQDLAEIEAELIDRRELADGKTTHELYLEAARAAFLEADHAQHP